MIPAVSSYVSLLGPTLAGLAVVAWPQGRSSVALDRLARLGRRGRIPDSPGRWARWLARRRGDGQRTELSPDLVMDLVACGLRAGLAVNDALACGVEANGIGTRAAYLVGVVARLRVGVPATQAWARPPPEYAGLAQAMVLASLSGAPAAAVVARAARDARAARREHIEREAARLGVRLVLPLGLAVLPGFVLLAVAPIVLGLATSVLGLGLGG
jgi:pilus assembly protein TadC